MYQNRVCLPPLLNSLLPSAVIREVACFVLYDHYPKDKTHLDITVCTNNGEVLEYYQHELISSLHIPSIGQIADIKILRNSKCELFYLVILRDEIIIVSKKDKLQIHNRVTNVESYTIDDLECTGRAYLKIIRSDDAVPLVFDDNFNNLTQKQIELHSNQTEESLPIVEALMQKLAEAKYTTKHNELKCKEYVKMRQAAAFSLYHRATFNFDDYASNLKLGFHKISNLLEVSVKDRIIKMCNQKMVMSLKVSNNNKVSIKDVNILLHNNTKQSIEHRTKVFVSIPKLPYWKETDAQISSHSESLVTAVIDVDKVQFYEGSRINFDVAVSFVKNSKTYILPLESVSISPWNVMEEDSDILLYHTNVGYRHLILCILSTSECFELHLRHITTSECVVTLSCIFHDHLRMDAVVEHVFVHKSNPFHRLHGVMVVSDDNVEGTNIMRVKVYTRFPSQVLALIHHIYQEVLYKIIVTTSDYEVSEIGNTLSNHNETKNKAINYTECATSMINQIKIIKEHIDECTAKMIEDGGTEIQDKIGTEVDLIASGVPKYLEFRKKILEENLRGIKSILFNEDPSLDADIDCVIIDDDV